MSIDTMLDACFYEVAKFLPDSDVKNLSQVSKECRRRTQSDDVYTPAANELRHAWRAATMGPCPRPPDLSHYERLQKFHAFVRELPPPLNALKTSRASDPQTYTRLEYLFGLQGAPQEIVDAVAAYPHEMPVLDLGDRRGATGYLDFLQPEYLAASVMRGVDNHGRAFLSMKVDMHYPSRSTVAVHTIFQRHTKNVSAWACATSSNTRLFNMDIGLTRDAPDAWKQGLRDLLETGEATAQADLWRPPVTMRLV